MKKQDFMIELCVILTAVTIFIFILWFTDFGQAHARQSNQDERALSYEISLLKNRVSHLEDLLTK